MTGDDKPFCVGGESNEGTRDKLKHYVLTTSKPNFLKVVRLGVKSGISYEEIIIIIIILHITLYPIPDADEHLV